MAAGSYPPAEIRPWKVRLTRDGRDVTDYTVEAPRGVETARTLREAAGDDPLLIGEAASDLLISRLYDAAASGELESRQLQVLTRALQESIKTSVAIRKERALDRAKTLEEAADRAEAMMLRKGISTSTVASIREALTTAGPPEDNEPEPPRTMPQELLTTIRRDVYGIHEPDPSAE